MEIAFGALHFKILNSEHICYKKNRRRNVDFVHSFVINKPDLDSVPIFFCTEDCSLIIYP